MHLHDTLPRRILMTTDTVGGVWTYSRDLSLGLADAGVSVTMVAFGGRADERQRSAVQHSRIHLVDSDLPLEWMPGDWSGVDASCALLRAVAARADPDLVHCNTYVHAALDWRQPVLAVGHSCVYSWFEAVHGSLPPQPQWTRYREGVRAGLQAADLVVTPTAAMRDRLDAFYGPLSDTRIIHNGCADAPVAVRSESPVILAAGRAWDGAKNFAVLDAIAPQLAWPIRIAGDAQGPDGSTAAFDHCQLLGRLSSRRLRRQMAQAGIFAHPARYEPFGLVALEAALCGCALVLADLPSLREVWGDAARYVHPDDVAGWGHTLDALTRDHETRRQLAAAAGRRARRYGSSGMCAAYMDAYAGLCASAACPTQASRRDAS